MQAGRRAKGALCPVMCPVIRYVSAYPFFPSSHITIAYNILRNKNVLAS